MKLASILLPGEASGWSTLGFTVDTENRVGLANGALVFGHDIAALTVEGGPDELPDGVDGIPVGNGSVVAASEHPNGAVELDHVVVMTDSLDRTSATIANGLGLEQRRVRETEHVRQAFHRFADHDSTRGCIVEVVENSRVERAAIWGVVVIVSDLDEAIASAPDLIGRPKPAVQPGRRIASVSKAAGLGTALAFMSA